MKEKAYQHLATAFVLETVAAARNEIRARKAGREGRSEAARLFRALVSAQSVHSNKGLMLLRGKLSSTDKSIADLRRTLERSVATYESSLEDVEGAVRRFVDQLLRTTKNHLGLLRKYNEQEETTYCVCQICGFIAIDKVPERCPVCGAVKEKFLEIA
jgi:rubrerythrin